MPSSFTHAFVGIAVGSLCLNKKMSRNLIYATALIGIMPDFDIIGNWLGAADESILAHRGITHSIPFAFLVGFLLPTVCMRCRRLSRDWWRYGTCFSLIIATHALLDMVNQGNLGVALFGPFDSTRYFFPVQFLYDAPRVEYFIQLRSIVAIACEILIVWIPLGLFIWGRDLARTALGWFSETVPALRPEADSVADYQMQASIN